jgi:hypothetical protein
MFGANRLRGLRHDDNPDDSDTWPRAAAARPRTGAYAPDDGSGDDGSGDCDDSDTPAS